MSQWFETLLVAIKSLPNGKYKVVELPPRQTDVITSRKTFGSYEQAEIHIDNQYPTALCVQMEDITLEIENRKVITGWRHA